MNILITGPVGSGKTTHAKILADKLGLCFVSVGELLRKKALEDSAEGRSLREDMKAGKLVDDEIAARVLKEQLEHPRYKQGFVLDGYPRELKQLEHYDPGTDIVFYLDVPDEVVRGRLISRGREDDTPDLIEERLTFYHTLTEPVLSYYQNQGKLIRVNGNKGIEEVGAEIAGKLTERTVYAGSS